MVMEDVGGVFNSPIKQPLELPWQKTGPNGYSTITLLFGCARRGNARLLFSRGQLFYTQQCFFGCLAPSMPPLLSKNKSKIQQYGKIVCLLTYSYGVVGSFCPWLPNWHHSRRRADSVPQFRRAACYLRALVSRLQTHTD